VIGKRAQGPAVAGKALGGIAKGVAGAAGSAASSGLTGLKVAGSAAGSAAIKAGGMMGAAGIMAGSQAANSLGQSKNALVSMVPSLIAFLFTVLAHVLATGQIGFIGQNLALSSILYTITFGLLAVAIIMRPNNKDKVRDTIVIITSMMILGMVQANPYYLLIMIAVTWFIYYFSDKEHFSETGTMLLLLMVAFYLDIGLLPELLSKIPFLSATINGLDSFILLTPWLGLVTVFFILPSSSGYINVIKMIFIGWYILSLLAALLTGVGLLGDFGENFHASIAENLENKAQASEQIVDCPSDAALMLQCFKQQLSNPGSGTIDSCIQDKKNDCIDEHLCKEEGHSSQADMAECKTRLATERAEQDGVSSKTDLNADRYVYATVSVNNDYTKKTILKDDSFDRTLLSFPFDVEIKNPLALPLTIVIDCEFEKGSGDSKETVAGEIMYGPSPGYTSYSTTVNKDEEMTRNCVPSQKINGSWYMKINLQINDIVSYSYLNRMLVHEWDYDDDLLSDALSSLDSTSVGANELARLNFAVGDPMDQKFIESEDYLTFQATLENVGKGQVTYVTEYNVDSSDVIEYFQDGCSYRSHVDIPSVTNKLIPLSHCTAGLTDSIKERLESTQSVEPYILYTFEGMIKFNYKLEDRKKIEIEEVSLVS